jgi:hypothetical protein
MDSHPDLEEIRLVVIPVELVTEVDAYGSTVITSINNYLRPSGVKLRKDPEAMSFQVVTSRYFDSD